MKSAQLVIAVEYCPTSLGEKEKKSVSSQTEGTVTIITVGNPPNSLHPSGTVSIKHTMLSSSGAESEHSLGKASRCVLS